MSTGTEKIYSKRMWHEFSTYMLTGTEKIYSEETMA